VFSRRNLQSLALLVAAQVLSGFHAELRAQVVELKGGTSTAFETSGATASIETDRYKGWLGLGWRNGFAGGFGLTTQLGVTLVEFGDQPVPVALPTDLFNPSSYFLGTGISVRRSAPKDQFEVFAGLTANRYGAPFLSVSDPDRFSFTAILRHALSDTVTYDVNIFYAQRLAVIQGLQWKPSKGVVVAGVAGESDRDPYAAGSLAITTQSADFKASYANASSDFRRIVVNSPLTVEYDRENVSLDLHPLKSISIGVSRENILSPDPGGGAGTRARVQGATVSWTVSGFRLRGAEYQSTTPSGQATAYLAGVERALLPRITLAGDYFRTVSSGNRAAAEIAGTVREHISSHLDLNQMVQFGLNQKSVACGGSYESHRIGVGLDYQTVYVPFYIPGQSQFRRIAMARLYLLLPRSVEVHGDTNISPTGQTRYTSYLSTLHYLDSHGSTQGAASPFANLAEYKCVVRGRIADENGEPISGAAAKIDNRMVYTDSEGLFFARFRKCTTYSFRLLPEEFLSPDSFVAARMPKFVRAVPEGTQQETEVVLRRLPRPAPAGGAGIVMPHLK